MVRALFVGLIAATICGIVFTAPINFLDSNATNPPTAQLQPPPIDDDPAARSERSTNLSHVSGTARKIQMFIKNRHLQLLPDGTVNGTTDDTSAYTILQRTAVGKGQMRIQGVATCQFLCMDACGLLYGSLEFGDECIFNETMEQHNYNTYSSAKYSNERKTLYLALNRRGQPRKVVLRARHQLGRLSSYTRVLFRHVGPERAEELHPMRHHGHNNCLSSHQNHHQIPVKSPDPPRCRKRKKRKKKKRKCPEDEFDPELCQKRQSVSNNSHQKALNNTESVNVTSVPRCNDNKDNDECQRDVTKQKKHKINSDKSLVSVKKKKKNRKSGRKRLDPESVSTETTTTTTVTSTITPPPDDVTPDEDYGGDSSTHIDWEDSTVLPDVSMAVSDATKLTAQPHLDSD